ncbi:MAG: type 1 glutamine amidotransferase [Candidatus Dadabacteria bacterium]
MIRIALLDLYEGEANEGMRCIRHLVKQWSQVQETKISFDEYDVRCKNEVPDLNYDIYISSGGPGSPLESVGTEWETRYYNWLTSVEQWNADENNSRKKFVLFICHSFQLAARYFGIGKICKRKSTAFGVFPVHVLPAGQSDSVFEGLSDPFYVVDSRDYQVIQPDLERIHSMGAEILCIEKFRPHVPYVQAIMGMRFNEYMIGTQFHPEADAIGMSMYLQQEQKKQTVIENHGEEKWKNMLDQLNDPEKIMCTHALVIPNFLREASLQLQQEPVFS